jgi:hypothetical protein
MERKLERQLEGVGHSHHVVADEGEVEDGKCQHRDDKEDVLESLQTRQLCPNPRCNGDPGRRLRRHKELAALRTRLEDVIQEQDKVIEQKESLARSLDSVNVETAALTARQARINRANAVSNSLEINSTLIESLPSILKARSTLQNIWGLGDVSSTSSPAGVV